MNLSYPRLYVSCSYDDDYGFFSGAQRFSQIIRDRGAPIQWVPIARGGHCAQSAESWMTLARFLVARD